MKVMIFGGGTAVTAKGLRFLKRKVFVVIGFAVPGEEDGLQDCCFLVPAEVNKPSTASAN